MTYDNKEFTKIRGYTSYYICKETTEVLSIRERKNTKGIKPKILKPVQNSTRESSKYYIITLVHEITKKRTNHFIHRLMGQTFLDNPNNLPMINHIDGNKHNNCLGNLEWCDAQHNNRHAVATGLSNSKHCEVEVHQYSLHGEWLAVFKSAAEAQKITGVAKTNISKVVLGLREQAGGYQWSYEKKSMPVCSIKILKEVRVTNAVERTTIVFAGRNALLQANNYTGHDVKAKFLRTRTNVITLGDFVIEKEYFE